MQHTCECLSRRSEKIVAFVQIGNGWAGITGLSDRSEGNVDVGALTLCDKLRFRDAS